MLDFKSVRHEVKKTFPAVKDHGKDTDLTGRIRPRIDDASVCPPVAVQ
jgi:hypothetical protein